MHARLGHGRKRGGGLHPAAVAHAATDVVDLAADPELAALVDVRVAQPILEHAQPLVQASASIGGAVRLEG